MQEINLEHKLKYEWIIYYYNMSSDLETKTFEDNLNIIGSFDTVYFLQIFLMI